MGDLAKDLLEKVAILRNELKNVRQVQRSLIANRKKELEKFSKSILPQYNSHGSSQISQDTSLVDSNNPNEFNLTPVGYIKSTFKNKNGTPRQSGICNGTTAKLIISSKCFNNPDHSLDGLHNFSHIWLLFIFHKNNNKFTKAKVQPPRLNGRSQGVFATRSPYRPNPIGLTLAKIVRIEGNVIYLSGVDIIDGTPVIDIKPYIAGYDTPMRSGSLLAGEAVEDDCFRGSPECGSKLLTDDLGEANPSICQMSIQDSDCNLSHGLKRNEIHKVALHSEIMEASWIKDANKNLKLNVRYTSTAEAQLLDIARFGNSSNESIEEMGQPDSVFINELESFKDAVYQILSADPRSSYRRDRCQDRLYFVSVDRIKLTCWFDMDTNTVEVLKVCEEMQ